MKGANSLGTFFFAIYLIAGLYFLNLYFVIVPLPASFASSAIYRIIPAIGGVLIILSGFNFLRRKNYYPQR